jgi:hypothetical protein
MPISYRDLKDPIREPIYTFVANDGTNTNIASAELFRWTRDHRPKLAIHRVPVDQTLAQSFLRDNITTIERCLELATSTKPLTPIIYCHDGSYTEGRPDVFLVDGHHRYCLMGMCRIPFIPAYLLSPKEWKPFEITDLPSITKTQLLNLPNLKRQY